MTFFDELPAAVEKLVTDGQTIAMEGFSHLIPFAAGHEIIRQGFSDLTLIRLTPDLLYDQMIGAGSVAKMVFGWAGNPGVGSLHRFRDSIENHWPRSIEIEEYNHAELVNAFVAGASGLPSTVMKGPIAIGGLNPCRSVNCPFTGESLKAVPAINPQLTVIHAQQADSRGNVMLWGIVGVQKEAVLAADRVLVTVEEIVDTFEPRPWAVVIPHWKVDGIVQVPQGAHPSYALDYTSRDNDFYSEWDRISRDRASFESWLNRFVYGEKSHTGYLRRLRERNLDVRDDRRLETGERL